MSMTLAETRYGTLAGEALSETSSVFRGIPYAAPPVGELRWKRPQPPIPWHGIRNAVSFSAICPQHRMEPGSFYYTEFYAGKDQVMQSEDCLYLNVWTPAQSAEERCPVLFWIHGGAFSHGSGSEIEFDGVNFNQLGVILVTINYRCNALGFLTHPWLDAETEDGCSGNYGCYDQIAALDWVRENITAFGGDPDNITIFGQSAGAMSVQTLISSPLAQGKFSKAIMQSGGGFGGLSLGCTKEQGVALTQEIIDRLGVSSLEELRQVDAWKLVELSDQLSGRLCPVIDGRLLPDSHEALARSGQVADVPYLLGSCQDEMGPESVHRFAMGNYKWCKNQYALHRRAPYLYWFNRQMPGDDDAGAFHSSELWYVFGTLDRCWRPMTEVDYHLSQIISSYWANFAKTGNPNAEGLPEWSPCLAGAPTELTLGQRMLNRPVNLDQE